MAHSLFQPREESALREPEIAQSRHDWSEQFHKAPNTDLKPCVEERILVVRASLKLLVPLPATPKEPQAALAQLETIDDAAREEGFDPASEQAKQGARRILEMMYQRFQRHYDVFPTPDREVAIETRAGAGQSVLVLCDSSGSVSCFATFGVHSRRSRYESAHNLEYAFVFEALKALRE